MDFRTIRYEQLGAVVRITANRPEVLNAQSRVMILELDEAFRAASEDDATRVIIVAGAGAHFSAGHDLGSPDELEDQKAHPVGPGLPENLKRLSELYLETCLRWREVPKPTIAQVQGYCIMGGLMLASCCDLIIAAEDALFADRAVRWGGSHVQYFSMPWDLGPRKAKEYLFTGDYLDAATALDLGLVNRVELDESCAGYMLGQVAALFRSDHAITGAVHDEGGYPDRGQDGTDVDLLVHLHHGDCRAGACRQALVRGPPLLVTLIAAGAGCAPIRTLTPSLLDVIDHRPPFLLRVPRGMVWGPGAPRIAAVQHQSRDTRGIRRGEQERHWSSLGDAEERGSLGAHGIHHGPHVIHPLLERRDAANAIGEPRAALVEPDEPRERAQALEEAGRPRMLPLIFQVRHEAGDDDEVERPASRHLVGDVQTAALRVLSLGGGGHDAQDRL